MLLLLCAEIRSGRMACRREHWGHALGVARGRPQLLVMITHHPKRLRPAAKHKGVYDLYGAQKLKSGVEGGCAPPRFVYAFTQRTHWDCESAARRPDAWPPFNQAPRPRGPSSQATTLTPLTFTRGQGLCLSASLGPTTHMRRWKVRAAQV